MKVKNFYKKLIVVSVILLLSIPSVAFASDSIIANDPASQTRIEQAADNEVDSLPVIYRVKQKTFVKNLPKVFQKDWTSSWANASSYAMVIGWTHKSVISINASTEILDGIKAQGTFTNERTYKCEVVTTIPADPARFSKLAHYRDFKQYDALVECIPGSGLPYDVGVFTVKEPATDSYNIVRYQN